MSRGATKRWWFAVVCGLVGCTASGGAWLGWSSEDEPHRARNVILFVGDGMGISTVTAARILEGQLRGELGEENLLSFEKLPHVALSKTWNTNLQVPDSAGTMTAMMTGVKTKAAVLSVNDRVIPGDHRSVAASRVPTLLEQAEARGLATGVVTTTNVTHATPGACYAHSPHRNWESDAFLPEAARAAGFPDIARQLIEFEFGDGPDVVLGGGRLHFLPAGMPDPEDADKRGLRLDGRDLTAEWLERHPAGSYVWNERQLDALDLSEARHVLGLFDPMHMEFEIDRAGDAGGEPSLTRMTEAALDILSRDPDGFFLMVEAGRIDHGHHAGNAHRALTDTIELSRAVQAALDRTDPEETLVVVTADHSHVFTIGGYPARGNDILGKVRSIDRTTGEPKVELELDLTGRPYTTLAYANGPGYPGASEATGRPPMVPLGPGQAEGPKRFPHMPVRSRGVTQGRPDLTRVDTRDPSYLQESAVPLPAETHAGEDVAVYAGGPGAEAIRGVQEQTFIYHAMRAAFGWGD